MAKPILTQLLELRDEFQRRGDEAARGATRVGVPAAVLSFLPPGSGPPPYWKAKHEAYVEVVTELDLLISDLR